MTPRERGYHDAQRGHTTCPYGTAMDRVAWQLGYDEAESEGLAELPRFGKLTNGRKRK